MSEALERQVGGTHYKGDKIQHVVFVHANGIPYPEANAIKYIMRHKKKNGRQDLEKAIHYLQILMELEYPQPPAPPPSVARSFSTAPGDHAAGTP